jgi:hypothetical protein
VVSVRHPLTLRERAWLAGQLRTVRGRGVGPGDQLAIDAAAIVAAGVALDEGGRVVDVAEVPGSAAADLGTAVAAIERIVRARRREAASPGAPGWAVEALRREEATLRLLRRVRNAAGRAARAGWAGS